MKRFSLNLPINSLSLGQCSIGILREMFARGLTPPVFPIGNPDLSTQVGLSSEFHAWLQHCITTAQTKHQRDDAVIRLWHTQGSLESVSKEGNRLITFMELDSITPTESNILKNQGKVYVTSNYTKDVFKQFDVDSTYLPIGFDSLNFRKLDRDLKVKGEISFLVGGKFEAMRKRHAKVIGTWVKKFGNKHGFKLNIAVHNPFLHHPNSQNPQEEAWQNTLALINRACEGKHYWNINPIPYTPSNAQYNETLQSSDVYLAMCGGEGRDLPAYHAVALGAHVVALNAHAYKDYLTPDNAVLVVPNSKIPCIDNIFFHQNSQFNVGNIFDWDEEEFSAALDKVVERVKIGSNTAGLKLQDLTYKDTVDVLLKDLDV